MNAWSLCTFCNMDYTSELPFLEMGKKVKGSNFKSEITFDQRYPYFIMGHSTQDVAFSTLLTVLSTIYKGSWVGTFWTHHELERDLKNTRTQLPAETHLDL